jgi:hypothetical protein
MRRFRSEAGLICRIATLRSRDRYPLQRAATRRSRTTALNCADYCISSSLEISPPLATQSAHIALDVAQSVARGCCQPLNHHPQNSVPISVKIFLKLLIVSL